MNRLKPQQREAVEMFMSFTESSENRAIEYLKKFEWNVERAADEFFINPPPQEKVVKKVNKDVVLSLFMKYGEKEFEDDVEINCIQGQRLHDFFTDLGIDPETDLVSLILPWQFNCKRQFYISKEEFISGMEKLKCEKLVDLKDRMGSLRAELIVEEAFKQFYKFVFLYAKGTEEVKTTVNVVIAMELWKLLLPRFNLLPEWLKFVEISNKGINQDVWNLLLDFTHTEISSFNSDDCWPVMIEDFVHWHNDNLRNKK